VTVIAQDVGYRQADRPGDRLRRIQCGPHVWVLDAACEGRREGLRIGDPGSDTAALVRLVAKLDTVDAYRALGRVELGRVLQVPNPALVHLLGNPAFVPDVRMPAALVKRSEYALDLGRAVARDGQPGTVRVVLVEVRRAVRDADVWQAGAPRLEAHESHVPFKISGIIGTTARLYMLPDRSSAVGTSRLRAIHIFGLFLTVAYFAHASVLLLSEAREPTLLSEM